VEEEKPAGNQPETAEEKRDQQQETEQVEDASSQPAEEQTSQEPEPAASVDNEAPDDTQTADTGDVSAPAESSDACADTSATTTANGPVDEVGYH